MGGMHDCIRCAADGNHAVYRIQLMGISAPLWFYLQYGVEYAISYMYHLCRNRCWINVGDKAYGNSAFEMEAEANEEVDGYLDVRTPFEFFRYYGKI